MDEKSKYKLIWSWAFYDWANSAFATTVMAGFFPLFFKNYWASDLPAVNSTYILGVTNSLASLLLIVLAPVLGAIADQGGWRKTFLLGFTLLGIGGSFSLGMIGYGNWLAASACFSVGVLGFAGGLIFYDALLLQVAPANRLDRVSGLGYGLGYLGGGLLFALNVWMYLSPASFGFTDGAQAIKASFISVAIWWSLFSLPLFLFVPESPAPRGGGRLKIVRASFASLWRNIRALKSRRPLLLFLIAFFFYNDAVNTIIKMAVDFGMSIGLAPSDLIKALLLVQFIGFPAALFFGYMGERIGALRGIWLCLAVYFGVTIYAYFLNSSLEFYILAAVIGLVQGGVQALSRSYYASLVKNPSEAAQYFGFFNMIGKFSSIIGPFLVGFVSLQLNNSRAGIMVLGVFFLVGAWLLRGSQRALVK